MIARWNAQTMKVNALESRLKIQLQMIQMLVKVNEASNVQTRAQSPDSDAPQKVAMNPSNSNVPTGLEPITISTNIEDAQSRVRWQETVPTAHSNGNEPVVESGGDVLTLSENEQTDIISFSEKNASGKIQK
jgi:hypothetical protein